ncbi:MAG: M28 family peptidase [Bacteroidota bacterium]
MKKTTLLFTLLYSLSFFAQTNIISTNPVAEQVMMGNYNPSLYLASNIINSPDSITAGINARISPDSLKSYIVKLASFRNRNTGSDTVSSQKGVGASRRWVYSKFQQFSAANENRLIPSYLQFDLGICGMTRHRNIFAVLPGMDTADKSIIIIEGHMDSRCEGLCDTACNAQGVEDNASGTALVIELCRVMSRYSYNHTIVFLVTIGEEQGLYGAEAFADYVQVKGIEVKAVQNNDVIGGIICGQTSSPPSCPGVNTIDSTQVRLFSFGNFNSRHKGLARFIKLEYREELLPLVSVPMLVSIMSPEDRTGRSGDHVPFRQHNYAAMRFTSANEHGDANVSNMSYSDRQHTTRDTLGADTDNDLMVDSFFVDFNYLARNACINGNSAAMLGIGPKQPNMSITVTGYNTVRIQITQQTQYAVYRLGVRVPTNNDWDTIYTLSGTVDTFYIPNPGMHYFQVMSVDTNGIESLPSQEYMLNMTGAAETSDVPRNIELMQNRPNPFDEATYISVLVNEPVQYGSAWVLITDLSGKEVQKLDIQLNQGINEILFEHGYGRSGIYNYTLYIDSKPVQSRQMIFAN